MLTLGFPIEAPDGRIITPAFEIETHELWYAYRCLVQGGMEDSRYLVLLAAKSNFALHNAGLPADLWEELWARIGLLLNVESIRQQIEHLTKPKAEELAEAKKELLILNFCYMLLSHRRITREEAARLAGHILGWTSPRDEEDQRRYADNWRKKLDRWARNQGLPSLGQTKRRPRKQISGNFRR